MCNVLSGAHIVGPGYSLYVGCQKVSGSYLFLLTPLFLFENNYHLAGAASLFGLLHPGPGWQGTEVINDLFLAGVFIVEITAAVG